MVIGWLFYLLFVSLQPVCLLLLCQWASTMSSSKSNYSDFLKCIFLEIMYGLWTGLFVHTLSLCFSFRAYRNNTLKHSSVYEALLPVFSPTLLFVLSTLWISLSPADIVQEQPRVFYLMVGTAFSNVTVSIHSSLRVEISELCSSNKGRLSVPVETSCSMSAPYMLFLSCSFSLSVQAHCMPDE